MWNSLGLVERTESRRMCHQVHGVLELLTQMLLLRRESSFERPRIVLGLNPSTRYLDVNIFVSHTNFHPLVITQKYWPSDYFYRRHCCLKWYNVQVDVLDQAITSGEATSLSQSIIYICGQSHDPVRIVMTVASNCSHRAYTLRSLHPLLVAFALQQNESPRLVR